MGGGGSIAAMNSSIKGNRKLGHTKKSLRETARKRKPVYNKKALLYRNTMTPEEYAVFKQKLIKRRERGKIQFVILLSFMALTLITALIIFSTI